MECLAVGQMECPMPDFQVVAPFKPTGDQPDAIERLVASLEDGNKYQTLLGVTGSGKTFTVAQVIERVGGRQFSPTVARRNDYGITQRPVCAARPSIGERDPGTRITTATSREARFTSARHR